MSSASCLSCTLRLVLTSTFHVALPPFCRLHSYSISSFCLPYSLWFLWISYRFDSLIPRWIARLSHFTILLAICSSWGSKGWVSGIISTREGALYGTCVWSWWWLSSWSSVCDLCFPSSVCDLCSPSSMRDLCCPFGHGPSVLSSPEQGTNQYCSIIIHIPWWWWWWCHHIEEQLSELGSFGLSLWSALCSRVCLPLILLVCMGTRYMYPCTFNSLAIPK